MKPGRYLLLLLSLCLTESFAQITLNQLPTRVVGQDSLQIASASPNLVEGREFLSPQSVALDTSTSPPALYVADTGNNRVLGFRNAAGFANGQHADIVLGQPDFATTFAAGPGRTRSTGLSTPTAVAVDASGNVYVIDAGNNRILRFPQPFNQSGPPLPDVVVGQPSFSTNTPNQGGISASTLSFVTGATTPSVLLSFLTFDAAGNLWVTDAGNNRVVRFNAGVLGANASSGPAADVVLGQPDFITNTYSPPTGPDPSLSLTSFQTPSGIAFDAAGRLFVAESLSTRRGRILMWNPPFKVGQAASRLLGVDNDTPQPPVISEFQLAQSIGGLFAIGNAIGVMDTANSRLLVYPAVEQWSPGTYQAAVQVAGQPDFSSGTVNQGQPFASATSLSVPSAAVFLNNQLYVADSGNHRVIVFPYTNGAFSPATQVLGQDRLNLNAPNLVEGREFNFTYGATSGGEAGLAVDINSNPPHLYVADTFNNRILGFNDLRNIQPGQKADIVIGQPDFQNTVLNYPSGNPNQPTASGLSIPTGLIVDSSGNLYVADTGNGRVLRFPQPFSNFVPGTPMSADLVLGQLNFTAARITDATARTMAEPYGLAFASDHGFLVSDLALNRVLYFAGKSADLVSGQAAVIVFGQPDFNSSGSGNGLNQMRAPRHISTDGDDRLYVADSGNGRVLIFNEAPVASPNSFAAYTLTVGLSSPRGVYVNQPTGDIWVSDAGTGQSVRYPQFILLAGSGGVPNATIQNAAVPLTCVEDAWGNLFVADTVNRVTIFYPGLSPINAANFLNPGLLAPGMISALFSTGNENQFGGKPSQATTLPLPTTLNGVQVLVNNAPAPLFYADPNQINFQVPMGTPQSGTADVQVLEAATGRLLGDSTVALNAVDPGLFTQAGNGIGAAAALNQDNTLNSQTNAAVQGSVIQLFGTGQGFIAGVPDGNVAGGATQTSRPPSVIMGTGPVPDANIKYAGLAPTLVGVWQINVLIPDTVITTPTNPTQVIVIQNSVPSGGGGLGRPVIIYVKSK
jgi:uncharacterized protein (TIGR03437 family)